MSEVASKAEQLEVARFQVGEAVQLKSGGPSLRVVDVPASAVTVEWEAAPGEWLSRTYPTSCLHGID